MEEELTGARGGVERVGARGGLTEGGCVVLRGVGSFLSHRWHYRRAERAIDRGHETKRSIDRPRATSIDARPTSQPARLSIPCLALTVSHPCMHTCIHARYVPACGAWGRPRRPRRWRRAPRQRGRSGPLVLSCEDGCPCVCACAGVRWMAKAYSQFQRRLRRRPRPSERRGRPSNHRLAPSDRPPRACARVPHPSRPTEYSFARWGRDTGLPHNPRAQEGSMDDQAAATPPSSRASQDAKA